MKILEIWPGSRLVLESVAGGESVMYASADPYVLYFLLALAFLAIISHKRIAEAIVNSVKLLMGGVNLKDVQNSKHSNDSVLVGFLLMIPFYAFVFCNTGISSLSYWWVLVAFVAYFIYKYLLFKILGWATLKKEAFGDVRKVSNGASFLIMLFSLPALIPQLFTENFPVMTLALYVLVVAILLLFIYFARIIRIFISSGMSVFFRFLYLCALEILPILLVVKAVVLTNAN